MYNKITFINDVMQRGEGVGLFVTQVHKAKGIGGASE